MCRAQSEIESKKLSKWWNDNDDAAFFLSLVVNAYAYACRHLFHNNHNTNKKNAIKTEVIWKSWNLQVRNRIVRQCQVQGLLVQKIMHNRNIVAK